MLELRAEVYSYVLPRTINDTPVSFFFAVPWVVVALGRKDGRAPSEFCKHFQTVMQSVGMPPEHVAESPRSVLQKEGGSAKSWKRQRS